MMKMIKKKNKSKLFKISLDDVALSEVFETYGETQVKSYTEEVTIDEPYIFSEFNIVFLIV